MRARVHMLTVRCLTLTLALSLIGRGNRRCRMPIPRVTYQLPLALDLSEAEEDASTSLAAPLSANEIKMREERARKILEAMFGKIGAPRWLDDYLELYKGGWPWRVAAYIAWASTPRGSREPKTQEGLARNHLGLM